MTKQKKIEYTVSFLLVLSLYLIFSISISLGLISRYYQGILNFICINIILAVSLNITVGNLGQITLGHAGFMSIGAYSSALFTQLGIIPGLAGYLTSILIGALISLCVGILIGIPGLRLKGDYLAIITLAFGEIIRVLIEYFDFTGGAQGLTGISRVTDFTIIYPIMVASVFIMYSIMTSRHGRAILSIREDEIASESLGVNTTYYKVLAFGISAMFAGVAGGIYAHNIGVLSAKQFDYNYSINILVMVVLGGMGSFTGAILSAVALTILPEMLRGFADYRMIIYSILLILTMIFRPKGLMGREEFHIGRVIEYIKTKFFSKGGGKIE